MRTLATLGTVLCLLVGACYSTSQAQEEVEQVLSVTPAGSNNYMAAEIRLDGKALGGLEWYHNDGASSFPEIIVVAGAEGEAPVLGEGRSTLYDITAGSQSWGSVEFVEPLTSSTGILHVVFRLPAGEVLSRRGAGGGPGIGVVRRAGAADSYLSGGGRNWVKLGDDYRLAVNPLLVRPTGNNQPLSAALRSNQEEPPQESVTFETSLEAPHPNPFNPRTRMAFSLSTPTQVRLVVYNLKGQRVRTLLDEPRAAGPHEVLWLGRDDGGAAVSSGVYFVHMEAGPASFVKRVALLR